MKNLFFIVLTFCGMSCAGAQTAYRAKTLNRIDSLLTPSPKITAAQVREAFYVLVQYSDSLHQLQPSAVVSSSATEEIEPWKEDVFALGFLLFVFLFARNFLMFRPRKEL